MQIIRVLYKLTLLPSKMAEGAKEDVHWCKGTAFLFSFYSFKGRNQIRLELLS